MSFIYLASPYSDPSQRTRNHRYKLAMQCVASLYKIGFTIFSPIVHCHQVALHHNLGLGAEDWRLHNKNMINASNALYILNADGWAESVGLKYEVKYVERLNRSYPKTKYPILMVDVMGKTHEYVRPDTWRLDTSLSRIHSPQ